MLIVTDADNTLWDTNTVFANAQNLLLDGIEMLLGTKVGGSKRERLEFVRQVDQKLCQEQKTFRYPPSQLVAVLEANVCSHSHVSRTLTDEERLRVTADFVAHLRTIPELRAGVREALAKLRTLPSLQLSVLSEGDPEKVSLALQEHGLGRYVDYIDMVDGKTVEGFLKVAERHRVIPAHAIAVGDQLNREIKAAKQAGFTTVFFPSGFEIYSETTDVQPDYTIHSSFLELVPIVERLERKTIPSPPREPRQG